MAMTADGKIATANRAMSSFGSRRDFEHLLELRSTADAVMSGARTVASNNVTLGPGPERFRRLRLERGLAEYNLRVIVSGSGRIDPKSVVFRRHFSPVIVLTTEQASAQRLESLRAVADEVKACGRSEIDFLRAFQWLRQKWDVKRLLCEGGGELNGALFRAGLVNELHLTLCPQIFGGHNAPTIADGEGALKLAGASGLRMKSVKRVADELFFVYEVKSRRN
jgi:2,5-diamino-6-(ribosylamino)-4(3H)-pyrimidinone 5'-phosphate reductase